MRVKIPTWFYFYSYSMALQISSAHIVTPMGHFLLKIKFSEFNALRGYYSKLVVVVSVFDELKLTCHHLNRRHICFNIKSIPVHPLLWMNVMLDFICMVFAEM